MSHFRKRLQLLSYRPFLYYLLSCLLVAFGTGMGYVAVSWMVVSHDNQVSAVAIAMLAFWAPGTLLSPLMGVFVDRYSQKHLIIFSNLFRAMLLIAFGFYLHSHFSLGLLYILNLLTGVCFSWTWPACVAFIRQLIRPEDLLYANASIDMAFEVGNVVGMGCAGLFVAIFSIEGALIFNGMMFLFAMIALLMIKPSDIKPPESKKSEEKQSFIQDLRDGFAYLRNNGELTIIYIAQVCVLIQALTAPALLAPFARGVLHVGVMEFGWIDAMLSAGIIIGGLVLPWCSDRWGLLRVSVLINIAMAGLFLGFSYNRDIAVAKLLYFLIGFGLAVWPLILTKAQSLTDFKFQGRVQSTFGAISGTAILLCYLMLIFGGHYFSVVTLYWVEVLFSLLGAGTIVMFQWRRGRISSETLATE